MELKELDSWTIIVQGVNIVFKVGDIVNNEESPVQITKILSDGSLFAGDYCITKYWNYTELRFNRNRFISEKEQELHTYYNSVLNFNEIAKKYDEAEDYMLMAKKAYEWYEQQEKK